MYAKFVNGMLVRAPYQISAAAAAAQGFKPVVLTPAPETDATHLAVEHLTEEPTQIVRSWSVVESHEKLEPTPEERLASLVAPTEGSLIATRNYSIGDLLAVGSTLYAVTAAIPSGGAITPGVNVTPTTMAEQLALPADKKS